MKLVGMSEQSDMELAKSNLTNKSCVVHSPLFHENSSGKNTELYLIPILKHHVIILNLNTCTLTSLHFQEKNKKQQHKKAFYSLYFIDIFILIKWRSLLLSFSQLLYAIPINRLKLTVSLTSTFINIFQFVIILVYCKAEKMKRILNVYRVLTWLSSRGVTRCAWKWCHDGFC